MAYTSSAAILRALVQRVRANAALKASLVGGIHEGEVAGGARALQVCASTGEKPLLECNRYLFRKADADKAPGCYGVAVPHQRDSLSSRDDLALVGMAMEREGRVGHRKAYRVSSMVRRGDEAVNGPASTDCAQLFF